jgi:hypothetical protein
MSSVFVRLDVSDLDGRDEYERAFYDAFSRVTSNRLVRQLWHWDDERRRLRIRLGYEDHAIFVSRRASGELHLAIAAHQDPSRAQSAAYGFAIPCESGIFEVLTFFTTSPSAFPGMRGFWRRFLAQMREAGLMRGYATCAAPLLSLYQLAGWGVADETEINGEARYLLTLRLDSGPTGTRAIHASPGAAPNARNTLP